jgi:hypothetical protein
MRSLLAVVVLVACGKSAGDKPASPPAASGAAASCKATRDTCWQYGAASLADGSADVAKWCGMLWLNAEFAMTPCPTANLVATCAHYKNDNPHWQDATQYIYEGMPDTREEMEKDCKNGGGDFAWKKP